MENKKQHWIPESYLKAWCDLATPADQEPYVWMFPRSGGEARRKAPSNIFHETDMYTVPKADGTRDLTIERGLSMLEGDFATIRRTVFEQHRAMDLEQHVAIAAFVVAMEYRSQKQRHHLRSQLAEFVKRGREIERQELRLAQSKRSKRPINIMDDSETFSTDDLEQFIEFPHNYMGTAMLTAAPIILKMDMAVLCTADDIGFITSDAPCVRHDPFAMPGMGVGLIALTSEITLPVSPRQALFFNRYGKSGYLDVPITTVDSVNVRTNFHADKHIVSHTNEARPAWFRHSPPASSSDAQAHL